MVVEKGKCQAEIVQKDSLGCVSVGKKEKCS